MKGLVTAGWDTSKLVRCHRPGLYKFLPLRRALRLPLAVQPSFLSLSDETVAIPGELSIFPPANA